jgi:hypothetical protein
MLETESSEINALNKPEDPYIFAMITANYAPLRFVIRGESDNWSPTLDQINDLSYDYVKLNRISTFVKVGIEPMAMVICYDGTLMLPALPIYQNRSLALEKFNSTLAELLLGGVYCEAVAPNEIGYGRGSGTGYTRIIGGSSGPNSSFIQAARHKLLGANNINLLHPEIIEVKDLHAAIKAGRSLVKDLGNIPKEQMLYATTFYNQNQWAESLLHFWSATERIVEISWQKHVVCAEAECKAKRRNFLTDNRTWPVSTKLEMLYQKKLLASEIYSDLDDVRKARNSLVHNGHSPTFEVANKSLKCFFKFLSLLASDFAAPDLLDSVVEKIDARCKSNTLALSSDPPNVRYRLPLPPLPGDKGWGEQPYEIVREICIEPTPKES